MKHHVFKRARVQGSHYPTNRPYGTISWKEHFKAWEAYSKKYGKNQSAERIDERGGFCWDELVEFLGKEPETWQPITSKNRAR
jgi:hypothetical protein